MILYLFLDSISVWNVNYFNWVWNINHEIGDTGNWLFPNWFKYMCRSVLHLSFQKQTTTKSFWARCQSRFQHGTLYDPAKVYSHISTYIKHNLNVYFQTSHAFKICDSVEASISLRLFYTFSFSGRTICLGINKTASKLVISVWQRFWIIPSLWNEREMLNYHYNTKNLLKLLHNMSSNPNFVSLAQRNYDHYKALKPKE